MDTISNLLEEVNQEADFRSDEVLALLLDKLEMLASRPNVTLGDALRFYISLKISRHHMRKQWYRGWGKWDGMSESEFKSKLDSVNTKIAQARRNYYVTKQRVESE
jgi:hypothetical protein